MIYRAFYPFDLSVLPGGAVISAIGLNVYVVAKSSAAGGSVTVVSNSQASNTTLVTSDYSLVGSTEWVAARTNFSALTASAYNVFTLNATAVASAQAAITGFWKVALRSSFDLDNSAPVGTSYLQGNFSEATGTANDPYLTVTYTVVAGPVPPSAGVRARRAMYIR